MKLGVAYREFFHVAKYLKWMDSGVGGGGGGQCVAENKAEGGAHGCL